MRSRSFGSSVAEHAVRARGGGGGGGRGLSAPRNGMVVCCHRVGIEFVDTRVCCSSRDRAYWYTTAVVRCGAVLLLCCAVQAEALLPPVSFIFVPCFTFVAGCLPAITKQCVRHVRACVRAWCLFTPRCTRSRSRRRCVCWEWGYTLLYAMRSRLLPPPITFVLYLPPHP